jgi:hypothetical protein
MASRPLKLTRSGRGINEGHFWVAKHGLTRNAWIPQSGKAAETNAAAVVSSAEVLQSEQQRPASSSSQTFDAVVHFVQAGSGTGVHVGGGKIVTCAHVVDARDDQVLDDAGKVGRWRRGCGKRCCSNLLLFGRAT